MVQKALSDPNASKYLAKYDAQPVRFLLAYVPCVREVYVLTVFRGIKRTGYVDADIDIHDVNIGAAKAIDAVNGEEVTNPSDNTLVPNTDTNEQLVKALKVVVGAVLVDAGFGR